MTTDPEEAPARYVFRATVRLDPEPGVSADPNRFETVMRRTAPPPVESVSFSELQTTEAYLDDLKRAIAADLEAFNTESVSEVLKKYLGSSIRVA